MLTKTSLLILGLITERPVNPYEIIKIINYNRRNLRRYVPKRTVYSSVKILEKKGYIIGKREKCGNMPEMTVYSVTRTGKELFRKSLLSYLNTPENNFSDLVLSTILLGCLDREAVLKATRNYRDKIKEEIAVRTNLISSADIIEESYLRRITFENTLNILRANLKTINELIKLASDDTRWSDATIPWWRNEYLQNREST
jgi:DNA-binding PadR family transcriptional regulator